MVLFIHVVKKCQKDQSCCWKKNGTKNGTCKYSKTLFTRNVFCTVSVSGIFDIFNAMCEQYNGNEFTPFLNGEKIGAKNIQYEQGIKLQGHL